MPPPASATGDEIAILWIQGAMCDKEAYVKLATEVQNSFAAQKVKAWVGIADFLFKTPEPLLIDKYITATIKALNDKGFKSNEIYVAAHSLGTVMV